MQYAWPPLNFNVPLRGVTSVTSWDSGGLSRQGLMSHEGPSRGLGSPVCVPRAVLGPGQGTAWRWCPIPSSEAGAGGRHVRRPPPSSPVPGRPAVSALGFACAALVSLSAFENASPRPAPRLSESRLVGGSWPAGRSGPRDGPGGGGVKGSGNKQTRPVWGSFKQPHVCACTRQPEQMPACPARSLASRRLCRCRSEHPPAWAPASSAEWVHNQGLSVCPESEMGRGGEAQTGLTHRPPPGPPGS